MSRPIETVGDVLALLESALKDMFEYRDKYSGLTSTFYAAKAEILSAVIAEIKRRRTE